MTIDPCANLEDLCKEDPLNLVFADIFLSHSSKDKSFVCQIKGFLDRNGYPAWLDVCDIAKGRDWWAEIKKGIDESTLFIWIVSPNSIDSDICHWEVEYATRKGKPIVVGLYHYTRDDIKTITKDMADIELKLSHHDDIKISPTDNWSKQSKYNFIILNDDFFSTPAQQKDLLEAVNDDKNYLQTRKKLDLRLQDWEQNKHKVGFLRRDEIQTYSTLNENLRGGIYELIAAHLDFISASQKHLAQTQRNRSIFLSLIATILFFLLIFALIQEAEARRQKNIAENNEVIAIANEARAENALQNFVLANNTREYQVGKSPNQPLWLGREVWVSDAETGELYRLRADNGQLLSDPIPVGLDALAPQTDGKRVWVSSIRQKTVTVIELATPSESVTLEIDHTPVAIFTTEDAMWIITVRAALKFEQGTWQQTASYDLGRDVRAAVYDGQNRIWLVENKENALFAIHTQTGDLQTQTFEENLYSLHWYEGDLWLVAEQALLRLNPESLAIQQRLILQENFTEPVFTKSSIWLGLVDSSRVLRLDRQSGKIQQELKVSESPIRLIIPHQQMIWVITSNGYLLGHDPINLLEALRLELPGASTVTAPLFDGQNMWFSVPSLGRIVVVDMLKQEITRNLVACDLPTALSTDGSNIWAGCKGEGTVMQIPAHLFYHGIGQNRVAGIQELEQNSRAHTPIYDGETLWIVQEVEGVLIRYDIEAQSLRGVLNLGVYPGLPVFEAPYYWVASDINDESRVLRFDARQEMLEPVQIFPMAAKAGNFEQNPHYVWIAPIPEGASTMGDDVELFDLSSNPPQRIGIDVGLFATGLVNESENIFWISVNGMDQASLVAYDVQTQQEIQRLPVAHTGWTPVITEDAIWFGGAFRGGAVHVIDCVSGGICPGALYKFDRKTQALIYQIPFENSPNRPLAAGRYIVVTRTNSFPIITAPYTRSQAWLTIVEQATGKVVLDRGDICGNLLPPYFDESTQYLWITCLGFERDAGRVMVLDMDTLEVVADYPDLGREGWPPVSHDDYIWMVYRDTNNAAVFRRDGELIALIGTGKAPSPPAFDREGAAWIANSRDATIQRLSLLP